MNKKHWITISSSEDITMSMIESWIDSSYDLVVSKLTKKQKMML
ncbi:MmcQ/YjbR family DNA-binding protein [Aliivibrio sifiae]